MEVNLKHNARPYQNSKPYPVPLNLQDETKRDLDMAVKMGILETVPIGEVTDWLAPMLAIAKKLGGVRRVINYKALNKQCNRAVHTTQPTFQMSISVPNAKQDGKNCTLYFSSLDAWNGYHSIPLSEASRNYFAFITPWGRYRYKVAPQGFLGSGDHYTNTYDKIQDEMIASCPDPELFKCPVSKNSGERNIRRCIDDTLVWASSLDIAFRQVHYILQFCSRKGIIFNAKKLKLGERSLNIFGYHLDQNGLKPTDNFMDALLEYPSPKNLKEMRGFFGVVAQCSWALKEKARQELGGLRTYFRYIRKVCACSSYQYVMLGNKKSKFQTGAGEATLIWLTLGYP
jgi:hypothetical protein